MRHWKWKCNPKSSGQSLMWDSGWCGSVALPPRSLGAGQSFGVDEKCSSSPNGVMKDQKVLLKTQNQQNSGPGWFLLVHRGDFGIVSFPWTFSWCCLHIFAWRSSASPLSRVLAFGVPSKTNLDAYSSFCHFPGGLRLFEIIISAEVLNSASVLLSDHIQIKFFTMF